VRGPEPSKCHRVYPLLVTGLEFAAVIVRSLPWPAAVVVAVALLRRELAGALHRIQSLEFPGGKATFAALVDYEKVIAAAAKGEGSSNDLAIVRYEETQFSVLEALAEVAPGQAIIDAWGLLEYQLNVASDRVAPDQPHGWPQVAHNLETWDKWPMLYPAALELRRLRDYTVRSNRPPSSSDAARYVSVAQDLVTTLRTSLISLSDGGPVSLSDGGPGGGE
jgi:hypothetical protein